MFAFYQRSGFVIALFSFLCASLSVPCSSAHASLDPPSQPAAPEHSTDRFLVIFKEDYSKTQVDTCVKQLQAEGQLGQGEQEEAPSRPNIRTWLSGPMYGFSIDIPSTPASRSFENSVLASPNQTLPESLHLPPFAGFLSCMLDSIAYIEKDSVVRPAFVRSSQLPHWSDNETQDLIAQREAPWHLVRISHRAPGSFKLGYIHSEYQGQGVDCYIVDSGIDVNNVEFEGRASVVKVFTNDGNEDLYGHGTHVAGIVGGKTFGVAKKARLLGVKIIDNDGVSESTKVVEALNWIYKKTRKSRRRALVNLSVQGKHSLATNEIIKKLHLAGVTVIGAAGNFGKDACDYSPGSSPYALIVGATDSLDSIVTDPPSNHGPCVRITAPGSYIVSSYIGSVNAISSMSGTSMASPLVMGVIALYLSQDSSLTPDELIWKVLTRATIGVIKNIDPYTPNRLLYSL